MSRGDILNQALFDAGGEIDGIAFGPLSPPVVMILRRRRNVLVADASDRDQSETEALAEILFVLSRTPADRARMTRDSAEEWQAAVDEFMAGLGDDTLQRFADEYLGPAFQAVQMALTESEGPGKSTVPRSPRTSPPSSPAPGKSGSTISPPRSAGRTRSGTSPTPPSCSSSSPTPSARAAASAGSTGRKQARKSSANSSASPG